jgi:hypothetical protein
MTENKILTSYKEKITSKVKNYIISLKKTESENPNKIISQIAYYSSELNNTSDFLIEEIFNENGIDLEQLFNNNPSLYYDYSILVRKSWIIKTKISKEFDNYCETIIKPNK